MNPVGGLIVLANREGGGAPYPIGAPYPGYPAGVGYPGYPVGIGGGTAPGYAPVYGEDVNPGCPYGFTPYGDVP
jgi:hypothetical protein